MSSTATSPDVDVTPGERLGALFEQLSELAGQRNAIDGRIVDIIAEIDSAGLWGATGLDQSPPWSPGRPAPPGAMPRQ